MIIGSGLLARAFAERFGGQSDVTLFASGVSNSQETAVAAFAREEDMLSEAIAARPQTLVYFGSCNTANPAQQSPYFQHKRRMERMVALSPGGLVLQLPQVVGRTDNPNTLTNYVRDRIVRDEPFTVWSRAERNLIDVDDVVAIATYLIAHRAGGASVIAVASPHSLPMGDIVALFEKTLGMKARVAYEDRGDGMQIDVEESVAAAKAIGRPFPDNYPALVIEKYYAVTTA